MSDVVIRLSVVLAVVAIAALIAYVLNRLAAPPHPAIQVGEVGDRPGLVLFTSTDCSTCKQVVTRLRDASLPFREVTHELESQRFEEWRVVAVPLLVAVDGSDAVVATLTGVPSLRSIRRAANAAGVMST